MDVAGRSRVVIERVAPSLDGGRFPIKRTVGDMVQVQADLFTDGHDLPFAVLKSRLVGTSEWHESPFAIFDNDRWQGEFECSQVGSFEYQIEAWVDHFLTWRRDLKKRIDAGQDITVDLEIGARLIEAAAARTQSQSLGHEHNELTKWVARLRGEPSCDLGRTLIADERLGALLLKYADRSLASFSDVTHRVTVDRERARFSAWYEVFPRSCSAVPDQHGTLRDVIEYLPYVASMGFDVLYMPPIHPIGDKFRKGKNNSPVAQPGDVGSPWAIGGAAGGHKSILPELGTLDDFNALVVAAKQHGLELALDIAFQCSPDHPYVQQHPEWFKARPDGTIQYAENPPKKYQDIYPFDFESRNWQGLWAELKNVFEFWIERGIAIFRVDNPHTKPFPFWEWCIGELKAKYPDVLFLAEAFTRPKVMYRLAKLGFSQSYTYFAWRNAKHELSEYLETLTKTEVRDFFRPNFWPNTPDILTAELQHGGRPVFMQRLILAATLCSNYGIYGPAFELCEGTPVAAGSEEYLNSEKYEIRQRDLNDPISIRELISVVNHVRRQNVALQSNDNLRFHNTENDQLLCYSKRTNDRANMILTVINLDPFHTQNGFVNLDLGELGLAPDAEYRVADLLTGQCYTWRGSRNWVQLSPQAVPAHVFQVRP